MENLEELVRTLVRLPKETSWGEFKHNCYEPEMVGERICGLANAAAADDRRTAYLLWGVDDVTHEILGTNGFFRERLGVPTSSAGSVSRVIAEAVEKKLIRPLDPQAGNRYMKYMPYWA